MFHLKAENILILLVVCTIAALFFSGPLSERTINISPDSSQYRFSLDTDVLDGGDTKAYWLDKSELEWGCDLGAAFDYPFCALQIFISDTTVGGLDLSKLIKVDFFIEYEGSADSIRLFLRNSNPAYTKKEDLRTAKFNMVELKTQYLDKPYPILKDDFRVADWWLLLFDLPLKYSHVEFNSITSIEIQSGSKLKPGKHKFKLNYIKLTSLWVSKETLYFSIIITWIITIVIYLIYRVKTLYLRVEESNAEQERLSEINLKLDSQTKELEEISKKDNLTKVFNRAGIEKFIYSIFQDWMDNNNTFSILFFDIDHFKSINDNYGHAAGDIVLKELAGLISENIRSEDKLARWGGEEFVIISAGLDVSKSMSLADNLRRTIDAYRFSNDLKVTVSFGVAEIKKDETLDELFLRVDLALYEAKNKGRNQVRTIE